MIGWSATIGRSRRMIESLAWLAAAALVLALTATGAALAMMFDGAGSRAEQQAVMLDLPPLEPAQALSDLPEAAPDIPMQEAPDVPDGAEEAEEMAELPDMPEETTPDMETPEAITPPEMLTETLPDTTPPPAPVETAEVALPDTPPPPRPEKPVEKVEKKVEKPKPEVTRRAETPPQKSAPSQASSGGQTAAAGSATASEIDRWKGRVQMALQRHMSRGRFTPAKVVLQIRMDAGGQLIAANVTRSSGDAGNDQQISSYLVRLGRVPNPPPGAPLVLNLPFTVR